MKWLGAVWRFLKGKKTTIGAIVTVVTKGLVATGQLDPATGELIENVAVGVLAGGLADKSVDQFRKFMTGRPVVGRK